jgi:hypothetical protein
MVELYNRTVETWIEDGESFCLDFMKYSFSWHHPVGADIDLLREEIRKAHAEWVEVRHEWQMQNFKQEAASLSYTKEFGILLWALSRHPFCGEMRPFEVVTAMQFCLSALSFYENRRTDRKTPFVFRMTEAGRHDLIMALSEKKSDALATYLAIDALFSRD